MVDVLGLDQRLDVVLQDPREVVLELGSSKVLDDLLPVGRSREPPEVGFHLAREDLERGGLTGAVGADEAEDLARARHR